MFGRRKSSLPPYLNPADRTGNADDQRNVQEVTGGDISKFKLNHVMVTDQTLRDVDACLSAHKHSIAYAKMYSGVYDDRLHEMKKFVKICRKNDIIPCVGGGATEDAIHERRLPAFVKELHALDIDTIEISNTTGDLPACTTLETIRSLRKDFDRVLVEIGTKKDVYRTQDQWHRDLDSAIEVDATKIILEGSGAGNRGIYSHSGYPINLLVTGLVQRAGKHADKFLIEAPRPLQRDYWMYEMFGWNAMLGNIHLRQKELELTTEMRLTAMQPEVRTGIEKRKEAHRMFYQEVLSICGQENVQPDQAVFDRDFQNLPGDRLTSEPRWKEYLRDILRNMRERLRAPQGRIAGTRIIIMGGSLADIIRDFFDGRRDTFDE